MESIIRQLGKYERAPGVYAYKGWTLSITDKIRLHDWDGDQEYIVGDGIVYYYGVVQSLDEDISLEEFYDDLCTFFEIEVFLQEDPR